MRFVEGKYLLKGISLMVRETRPLGPGLRSCPTSPLRP